MVAMLASADHTHLTTVVHRTTHFKHTQQKNDLQMKIVLVGLPGFEFCLQNRADTTKKGADHRSSNKSLSYRLNQQQRESGGATPNNMHRGIMFAMEATELRRGCEWL